MKAAEIRLRPPDGAFPGVDSELTALSGVTRESLLDLEWFSDGTYALLYRLSGDGTSELQQTLTDSEEVLEYDVVSRDGGVYLFVHVTEREALSELLRVADRYTLLLDRPFTFTADGVAVTAAGNHESLQRAFAAVNEKIPVSVEWTGSFVPGTQGILDRLTDRQCEALETAHELGFYEKPRQASYDDIAVALDCAPSTANELLRRAEATLVDCVLEA